MEAQSWRHRASCTQGSMSSQGSQAARPGTNPAFLFIPFCVSLHNYNGDWLTKKLVYLTKQLVYLDNSATFASCTSTIRSFTFEM